MQVSRDPGDDERRLFLPVKNNLAKDRGGYAFRIATAYIDPEEKKVIDSIHIYAKQETAIKTSKVVWEQQRVNIKADDALDSGDDNGPAAQDAKHFLIELLKQGPIGVAEINQHAKDANISRATLKRAKLALKVQSTVVLGEGGKFDGWQWRLPPFGDLS